MPPCEPLTEALSAGEIAPFVKILGCYPMDMSNSALPSPIVETPAAEEVTEQLEAGLQAAP